jgi:hypothetical protein
MSTLDFILILDHGRKSLILIFRQNMIMNVHNELDLLFVGSTISNQKFLIGLVYYNIKSFRLHPVVNSKSLIF